MKQASRKLFVTIAILSIFLTGCATINPATGKKEFILISTSSEVNMGKNVHNELMHKYKPSNNLQKTARLKAIGQRLAAVSDRQDYKYNFYLVENEKKAIINAFTTPGGNIYIFMGLYDKLKTDDEIAAVLSHEIGHCAAKHIVKKIQASMGYNIIGTLLYTQISRDSRQKFSRAANSIVSLLMLGYSREDEYLADKLGIKYMHLAGFDPYGTIKTFEVLKENSKGPQGPIMLRSHPYLNERIQQAKIEIEKLKKGREWQKY